MLFSSVVHSFCDYLGKKRCFRHLPLSLLIACRDNVDNTWNRANGSYGVNPGLGGFTFPPPHRIGQIEVDDDYVPEPVVV
jgi:hypothetical protein